MSWQVAVYEAADGKRPALEYLGGAKVPDQPRRELLLTVLAVVQILWSSPPAPSAGG
jgi:hypothetical protein